MGGLIVADLVGGLGGGSVGMDVACSCFYVVETPLLLKNVIFGLFCPFPFLRFFVVQSVDELTVCETEYFTAFGVRAQSGVQFVSPGHGVGRVGIRRIKTAASEIWCSGYSGRSVAPFPPGCMYYVQFSALYIVRVLNLQVNSLVVVLTY